MTRIYYTDTGQRIIFYILVIGWQSKTEIYEASYKKSQAGILGPELQLQPGPTFLGGTWALLVSLPAELGYHTCLNAVTLL